MFLYYTFIQFIDARKTITITYTTKVIYLNTARAIKIYKIIKALYQVIIYDINEFVKHIKNVIS